MNNSEENLYFIAFVLPSPLQEEVSQLKTFVAENFGSKAALRSPAHITLQMPFKKKLSQEADLFLALSLFAQKHKKLQIHLKDFNCFTPRVIYIDVIENQTLWLLQKALAEHLAFCMQLNQSTYRNQGFYPHVTIAFRDLKKTAFTLAWNYFKSEKFEATFDANKIALLKHNGTVWETKEEFILND